MDSQHFWRFLLYWCFLQLIYIITFNTSLAESPEVSLNNETNTTTTGATTTTAGAITTTAGTTTTTAGATTTTAGENTTTAGAAPVPTTTAAAPTTTTLTPTTPEAPPVAPTNLTYTALTTSVNLTWNSPQNQTYNVNYQSSSGGSNQPVYNCQDRTMESCEISGLSPGSSYVIIVTYKTNANSKASNASTITVITRPFMEPCTVQSPSERSMNLIWKKANATINVIYSYQIVDISLINQTRLLSVLIQGLTPGRKYNFTVSATVSDSTGATATSENVSCSESTYPDTPTINVTNPTETSVLVSYSIGSTDASANKTLYYSNGANYSLPVSSPPKQDLNGLLPGCRYIIFLVVQSYGKVKTSNFVTIITVPVISDKACTLVGITNDSMQLSWSPGAQPSVPVFYTVQYNTVPLFDVKSPVSITQLTPGTMYLFEAWTTVTENHSLQSQRIKCSDSTVPGTPSNIAVTNITTSSMEISWSTSGTNVTNSTTINCTCANDGQQQQQQILPASANWTVLSDLKPGCNNSFCITIQSYDKTASNCSWAITRPVVPTITGIYESTASSFLVTWEFGLTNSVSSTRLSYCDVTRNNPCSKWSVPDNATSAMLTNLSHATNYSLTLEVESYGNVTNSLPAWAVTNPILTGVCSVDFRNATSMHLLWPVPSESVALTYIVSYLNISLESSSFSAPYVSFVVSARPYEFVVQNLLAGATYRFLVLAFPSGATNSFGGSNQLAKSNEITCLDTTDPYRPKNLTYTTTYNSVTITIYRPSNTVNIDHYIANITSSKGVSPELHSSQKVTSTGADQEVKFINLAAASRYKIEVTSVVYGDCDQTAKCSYESQQPATIDIMTNIDLIKIVCLAVIIPAFVLIILLIIVIVFCLRKKRQKGERTSETSGEPEKTDGIRRTYFEPERKPSGPTKPVHIDKFRDHVQELEKDSGLLYTEDYEDLKLIGRDQSTSCSELEQNRTKNRYVNIKPYDVTRVKLLPVEDEDGADFINASWMPGFNSKREFIATQGPLPCTKDDFWRMIWEYNSMGIVMLTNCIEKGKNKCDYYWPQDMEPVVYGDIQVSITKEELTEHWNIRQLSISMGQQQKSVVHLHYHVWPDMDVPSDPATLIQFVRLVRTKLSKRGGPITVHCSAGVGRTGTYIAIDTLLHQLDRQDFIDVFGVVYKLRLNRLCMVQTESQYVFLYRSMIYELENRSKENVAEEDEMYANFNGGQKKKKEDEMYANFDGGPKKKAEDEKYGTFKTPPTNAVSEMDGKFFFTGPQAS